MKRLKPIAGALFIVLATVGIALASGGEGEHANDWGNFAFRVVNFIIFIGIIYFAAGKKIGAFFSSRRYNIESELKDLGVRKEAAERSLKEVESKISNLEQERQRILADYQAQGEALKASIIDKAKVQAEQIKAQAQNTAAQEVKYAVEQIRSEMSDLVIAAAQKLLESKLSKEEHEKLIDKYLTKVVLN